MPRKPSVPLSEIARVSGISYDQAVSVFEAIRARVSRGQTVVIINFGRFERTFHREKIVDTPMVEEPLCIPGRYRCKFSQSEAFRRQLQTQPGPKTPAKTSAKKRTPTKKTSQKGKKKNGTKQRK